MLSFIIRLRWCLLDVIFGKGFGEQLVDDIGCLFISSFLLVGQFILVIFVQIIYYKIQEGLYCLYYFGRIFVFIYLLKWFF